MIWAMPERKRFFSIDVFPLIEVCSYFGGAVRQMFNRPTSPPYTTKVCCKEGLEPVNNPKSSGNTVTRQSIRSRPVLLRALHPNRADCPDHLTTLIILITPTHLTTANTQSTLITPTWNNNLQNICQNNNSQSMSDLKKKKKLERQSANLQKVCLAAEVAESCVEQ